MARQTLLSVADTYSTTDPKFTYFNIKTQQADNELRETFEVPFDNSRTYFGSVSTCTIPTKSDIMTALTLRTILPPIYPVQSDQYVYPTPSSQFDGTVYVNMGLTQVVADAVTLTANTTGNHYFSVGAQVTLTGTKYLIFNLDGTYTISSIPTANSFTCSTTLAGVSYNGTASSAGITCGDTVSYFSTQNSNLWVNNVTNKTWQITGATVVGTTVTFTTSAPSNFPTGSQIVLNLPVSGYLNEFATVTVSTNTTFTCTVNGTFVISGKNLQIYSSDNGRTWTRVTNPALNAPYYTAYGNGVFVLPDSFYSTDNARTWTAVASPIGYAGAAFGNSKFVSTSYNSQAYSTDNGRTWTTVASPLSGNWSSVSFGNNTFVMVGQDKQAYSTDNGLTWNAVASSLVGFWNTVKFGNGRFVMVGSDKQAYSTDNGVTWTVVTSPLLGEWKGLDYGNGVFVMARYQYLPLLGTQAYSTDNGLTWNIVTSPLTGYWTSISFGNGTFVMVGSDPNYSFTYRIAYSADGLSWTLVDPQIVSSSEGLTYVTYGSFTYANSPSDSVSLVVPPLQLTNRVFSSSVYPSISFANADDAAFWGFDSREGLTYSLTATPPWTYAQGGWINGFLPPSTSTYDDSVAHKLCKSVTVYVGNQTITEYTGEYLELKNDLTTPYQNKALLKLMNGTLDQTQATVNREYYVNLPFGTKEVPLCALTRQDMSVEIEFEKYQNLSQNLNQGTGAFTDSQSYTTYNASTGVLGGQAVNVQTTFSYQQYIFVVTYAGQFIVYDTTKSVTDPTSYITLSTFSGTNLFKQFCVLSSYLYIGLSNGNLARLILSELVQGNISSFILNNYVPTTGTLTGTIVADFRYVYYTVSNTASSNVFMTRYDTTGLFTNTGSYTTVDFTKTFNSNVTGVYQILSTGTQLFMLPQGTPGKLYTYQLNANVQSQWYSKDYSSYNMTIKEGVIIGNVLYFCGNFNILKYSNSTFTMFYYLAPTFVTVGSNGESYSINNGRTWLSTQNFNVYLKSVTYGNGVFVDVGFGNFGNPDIPIQAYSTDNGRTWTAVTSPLSGTWMSVTYGNGTFVMTGTNVQAYSTDNGRTWTAVTSPLSGTWMSVTYGNGTFVMTGTNVQAYSVDNGRTWTAVTSPLSGTWRGAAFGNGTFVMVGSYNSAYSTDNGRTWNAVVSPVVGDWYGVAFGNGTFVMVGGTYLFSGGKYQAYSNDNGLTWTAVTNPLSGGTWYSVTFGNGIFNMSGTYDIAYSFDYGKTWTQSLNHLNGYNYGIACTSSKIPGDALRNLIAVGNYIYCSTSNVAVQIDTSKDLSTAAAYTFPAPLPVNQYVFANGPRYVYMFAQGDNTATNIIRYDPYPPITTLQASILVDYKTSKTKPKTASLHIVQSQKVTSMERMDIRCPVKEMWLMGATNGYQYSNLAAQSSLLINGEPLLTLDVGTQKYLKTIQPFETHTSMPVRNFSVLSFELDPESPKPNGTINFSRIKDQQFTGGATHAWVSTYNILAIKDGLGGLMFNF